VIGRWQEKRKRILEDKSLSHQPQKKKKKKKKKKKPIFGGSFLTS